MKRLVPYLNNPVCRQLGGGAVAGSVTSLLGARLGKTVVVTLGATVLLVAASRRGLVSVKVNWRQVTGFAVENRYIAAGFTGGLLLGNLF